MLKLIQWYKKRQRIKAIKEYISALNGFIAHCEAPEWHNNLARNEIKQYEVELKQLEN